MLAYLIGRGGTPVLRDEVAEALWPDGEPTKVQHLPSNAAYFLQRAMKSTLPTADVQPFVTSGQRYQLRSGVLRVDVDAFEAHLRRAEALEDLEALAEYERALAVESRDVEKAMELYRPILARDPIDEEAARGLMRCYAKLGDANGARKVYRVLSESLRRELEYAKAEPLPETTALFRELTRQPEGR